LFFVPARIQPFFRNAKDDGLHEARGGGLEHPYEEGGLYYRRQEALFIHMGI
jgi:hypothetical protein